LAETGGEKRPDPFKSVKIDSEHFTSKKKLAIIEFICDQYDKDHKLSPAPDCPPEVRANWLYWIHYSEGSLMPLITVSLIFKVMVAKSMYSYYFIHLLSGLDSTSS
jgi:glutathione S-transferase